MLMLLMRTNGFDYAINSAYITEIIPLVKIKKIPLVPEYIIGQINYNGKPVPVADLSLLIEGSPSEEKMHTRIILLETEPNHHSRFGLMAENVTETTELDLNKFQEPGISPGRLSFFGGIYNEGEASIQLIDVEKLADFLELETCKK